MGKSEQPPAFGNNQLVSQDSSINEGYQFGSQDKPKYRNQKSLSQFVMKSVPETLMEKPLTPEDIDQIPGIREQLGKKPSEPIYQRELFKLLVKRAMDKE